MPFIAGLGTLNSRRIIRFASAPTSVSASANGAGSISVSYNAPSDSGGTSILKYEYSINSGTTWADAGASPFTISSLGNGTAVNVLMRAVTLAGGGSSASASATTPNLPTAPSISIARQASETIRITLSAASAGDGLSITGYEYRIRLSSGSYGSYSSLAGTTGPWDIAGLSNGSTYVIQLRGVSAAGAGSGSNEPSAIPSGVPLQVGTPTSYSGDRSFSISWAAPSNNGSAITGYRVQWSNDNGATWQGTSTTTNTSFAWTLRNNGTSYIGKVQAYNANGDGAYSAASSAKTPAFTSSGTISVSQNSVSAPVYSSETNQLLVSGVGTQQKRPATVSFDPPDVSAFSYCQIFGRYGSYSYSQVGSNFTSSGAQSLNVTSVYIPDIPLTIDLEPSGTYSFFMRTYNSDGDYIDTGAVTLNTTGLITYYTYDSSITTLAGGNRNVNNKDYSNNYFSVAANSIVSQIQVFASRSNSTTPIATSQKYFAIAWANSTNYGDAFVQFNPMTDSFDNFRTAGGPATKNVTLGISNNYGSGFVLQIRGNGTTAGTWDPYLVVSVNISYRNRYTNYW